MIWWWHWGSREGRVPLFRIRKGWSVTMRSIHEGLQCGVKLVGSEMICERFSEEKRSSISFPSGLVSPSGHHSREWALKSPVKNIAYGFSDWIAECSVLKLEMNSLNFGELCLFEGLRYTTVKKTLLRWNFNSRTMHSLNARSSRTMTGKVSLYKRPTPPCGTLSGWLAGTKVYPWTSGKILG